MELTESEKGQLLRKQSNLAKDIQKLSKEFMDSLVRTLYLNKRLLKAHSDLLALREQTGKNFLGHHIAKGSKHYLESVYHINYLESQGKKVVRDPEL